MTFDNMWNEVKGIPTDALKQIPDLLSDETKNKMRKLPSDKVASIVNEAIDEVNKGAVEKLDVLISRRL